MKKLKGTITITRRDSSRDAPRFTITVRDELSSCYAIEVEMTAADFAMALSSCLSPCEFEFNDSGVIGMTREWKTLEIPDIPDEETRNLEYDLMVPGDREKKLIALAHKHLAPYEVDGWTGRTSDLFNSHNWVRGSKPRLTRVNFERYVPTPEKS